MGWHTCQREFLLQNLYVDPSKKYQMVFSEGPEFSFALSASQLSETVAAHSE